MKCTMCQSERLVPYAPLIDKGDASDLELAVQESPEAKVFKGWHLVKLSGTVCCDCGKVSFTALGDLEEMWKAFKHGGKEVAEPNAKVVESPPR